MSKRVSTVKRFDTDAVQGEGSYVKMRSLKLREVRALRKERNNPDFDGVEQMADIIAKQLIEWNWVDDEGEPIPCTPEGVDELTEAEAELLATLLIVGEAKN